MDTLLRFPSKVDAESCTDGGWVLIPLITNSYIWELNQGTQYFTYTPMGADDMETEMSIRIQCWDWISTHEFANSKNQRHFLAQDFNSSPNFFIPVDQRFSGDWSEARHLKNVVTDLLQNGQYEVISGRHVKNSKVVDILQVRVSTSGGDVGEIFQIRNLIPISNAPLVGYKLTFEELVNLSPHKIPDEIMVDSLTSLPELNVPQRWGYRSLQDS